jgi:hypothetical protein
VLSEELLGDDSIVIELLAGLVMDSSKQRVCKACPHPKRRTSPLLSMEV